jgi:hypothetical protein
MSNIALQILINAKDEASKVVQGLNRTIKDLQPQFKQMALVGAAGFVGVTAAALDFIAEARESQAVTAATDQVLKTMGKSSGQTAKSIADLAGELQNNSLYTDEAIQSGENLLLTFGNIGKDTFPKATRAMVDLSQAMGQDMKASAIQLGKALNDPVEGVSALSRVGVSFSESQKETIKRLAETGQTAKAQAIILEELNKQFGGQAQAARDAAGPLADLNQIFGQMKEDIGNALLPIMDSLLTRLSPILGSVASWVAANPELVAGIVATTAAVSALIAVIGGIGIVIPILATATATALPWIATLAAIAAGAYLIYQAYETNFYGFRDIVNNVLTWIQQKWAEWGPVITAKAQEIVSFLTQKWQEWGPIVLEETTKALTFLRQKWDEYAPLVQAAVTNVSDKITTAFNAIRDFIDTHGTEISAAFRATWDTIKLIVTPALLFIKFMIESTLTLIGGVAKVFLQLLAGDFGGAWETIKSTAVTLWGQFATFLQGVWDGVLKNALEWIGKMVNEAGLLPGKITGALADLAGTLADVISKAMKAALDAMIEGAKGLVNEAIKTAQNIANALNPANMFGGGEKFLKFEGGGIGKRASGGPVAAGMPYIVGEQGPELFIPAGAGNILPNSRLQPAIAGAGSGGSNILFDFRGSTLLSENTAKQITDLVIQRLQKTSRIPSR